MANLSNVSAEDLKNPDYVPPMGTGITLGLQHVLAMFVSNFTPAIIIGGAAGFAFGSADAVSQAINQFPHLIYLHLNLQIIT